MALLVGLWFTYIIQDAQHLFVTNGGTFQTRTVLNRKINLAVTNIRKVT